jgi:ribose 5-phosphate isomerase B
MKLAIAADHAGYPLKELLIEDLLAEGHEVTDLGTHHPEQPDDYPDFAGAACEAVLAGEAERAIIVCGSGVGASIVANKFPGIRAGLCHDHYSAHQGVEHDEMNVLCLGARIIGPEVAREIARVFVSARYSGQERHERRIGKLKAIENRFLKTTSP